VVLLHGGGGTWRQWERVIPLLTDSHTVLAPTMAWHWGSDHTPPDPMRGIDVFADGVANEIAEHGWEQPHIVGGSLGGWVALRLAARGDAGTAVALSPAGGWKIGGLYARSLAAAYEFMGSTAERFPRLLEAAMRWPLPRRALTWHHFGRPRELSTDLAIHFLHSLIGCDRDAVRLALESTDGPPSVQGARCPVLFLYPRIDFVVPRRTCRRLQAVLPEAEEIELGAGGHASMVDAPERVAEEIIAFAGRYR
jgi:pimeloyl-ACP methyl ester carboxylesterase